LNNPVYIYIYNPV